MYKVIARFKGELNKLELVMKYDIKYTSISEYKGDILEVTWICESVKSQNEWMDCVNISRIEERGVDFIGVINK